MNRQTRPALAFAGALLVAAVAVGACGPGDSARAGTSAPDVVPTAQMSPTLDPEAGLLPSSQPSDAASATPAFDPGTAIDAVDSDLAALDRFLNGLDTSLSGSDGGAYGGE